MPNLMPSRTWWRAAEGVLACRRGPSCAALYQGPHDTQGGGWLVVGGPRVHQQCMCTMGVGRWLCCGLVPREEFSWVITSANSGWYFTATAASVRDMLPVSDAYFGLLLGPGPHTYWLCSASRSVAVVVAAGLLGLERGSYSDSALAAYPPCCPGTVDVMPNWVSQFGRTSCPQVLGCIPHEDRRCATAQAPHCCA